MDQLKWGIIGSIEKFKAFEADLLNTTAKHVVQAFLPVEDEDTTTLSKPELQVYYDFFELLQSDIDAVYIASPSEQHYMQIKHSLLHHKAVLCERPITRNADELRHLMQLSEHNNTFMMEAMWIRFLPSIRKVLSVVSSGAIGEIVSVKAAVSLNDGEDAAALSYTVGTDLLELGSYPVFLCTLLLGKPEYVQATGQVNKGTEGDFFSAFLSYEGGQYGFIETSKLTRGNAIATITGSKGAIQIKNPWSEKPEGIEVDYFDGTKVLHKSEWEGYGLQFELDEVYECLEEGVVESQLYCHHFSLDVMETMDDIRKQLR